MNFYKERGLSRHVILSAAKDLRWWHTIRSASRSFAALRMTGGQYPRYVVKVHDEEGTIRKRGRKKHA
jgi:hypothetical protein